MNRATRSVLLALLIAVVGGAIALPFMDHIVPFDLERPPNIVVIMTEWNEFRGLDLERLRGLMKDAVIVDARNALDPVQTTLAGFRYVGTGRGSQRPVEALA